MLEGTIPIVVGQFAELNSFGEVLLNRRNTAAYRFPVYIIQQDPIAVRRGHLRNTVTHCACPDHGNSFDFVQTASWSQRCNCSSEWGCTSARCSQANQFDTALGL